MNQKENEDSPINYTLEGKETSPLVLFAHGAGADSHSDFMRTYARQLCDQGFAVARFDFPYMLLRQQAAKEGNPSRRPPDRAPVLLKHWAEIIVQFNRPCIVLGKSMGGRMASMLAQHSDELAHKKLLEDQALIARAQKLIKGCACLGYPFHPQGQPQKLRIDHLQTLHTPQLMVQGSRDKLGDRSEVADYKLAESIEWCWLEDGDHDLKPRKASGFSHDQHIATAVDAVTQFARRVMAPGN